MRRMDACWLIAVVVATLTSAGPLWAQADEIQVYDGGLAPVGTFNLTWHNNYTVSGSKAVAFPGAVVSNHAWVGVAEWALGVTDWFEAGLYLPLYSVDDNVGGSINGFKLRTLFAVPGADDRRFFYGANFEFSYNGKHWDTKRFTSEIRPIVGWHFTQVDLIFNPIIDTNWDTFGALEIVPAARLAYNASDELAIALEEYAGLGTFDNVVSTDQQWHQLYGVVDYAAAFADVEIGVGFGLTGATDDMTLKMILARDLN